jgi:hypothetical protein
MGTEKDSSGKGKPPASNDDQRRDRNLAEWFEKNPMPQTGKREHTEGINLDDIINAHATGGLKGADQRLARDQARLVTGTSPEAPVKFRAKKSGESDQAYKDALFKFYQLGGKDEALAQKAELEGLMPKFVGMVNDFRARYEKVMNQCASDAFCQDKDLGHLASALKKIGTVEEGHRTLSFREHKAMNEGDTILQRHGDFFRERKLLAAAKEFKSSDDTPSLGSMWRNLRSLEQAISNQLG